MSRKDEIMDALVRRALGQTVTEQSEEYAVVDGDMTLVKKKISVKELPPELSAIKLLIETGGEKSADMDESMLEKEKTRLLKELAAIEKDARKAAKTQRTNKKSGGT